MARTLPGVGFQAVPPPLGDKLPRMDVAAFVGFAAAGPLNTPVPVEDEVHFRDIFGADLDLAWGPGLGTTYRSGLGPAVRSFFRNGGRRCWIIRVADESQAAANTFDVPGLAIATGDAGAPYRSARLQARSEGAWSDRLRVGASLSATRLGDAQVSTAGGAVTVRLDRRQRAEVQPGDLLRLAFRQTGAILFLAVSQVAEGRTGAGEPYWQAGGNEFWFAAATGTESSPPGETASPATVTWLAPAGGTLVSAAGWWEPAAARGEEYRVYVPTDQIPPGISLLQVEPPGSGPLLLTVQRSWPAPAGAPAGWAPSPPSDPQTVLAGRNPLWPLGQAEGQGRATGPAVAERLAFDLWVEDDAGETRRVAALGFAPPHPRYLGGLPSDTRFYYLEDERAPSPDGALAGAALWPDAARPRFPLAAPPDTAVTYLPLGMDFMRRREQFAAADPPAAPADVRNGLQTYSPDLFLDPDLKDTSAAVLAAEAFHKRHIRGEPLQRLHAVWPLEEVTIVAIPDALHPPWLREAPPAPPAPLAAPALAPVAGDGPYTLAWTAVSEATGYVIQQAGSPHFTAPVTTRTAAGTALDLAAAEPCPQRCWFRVRAMRGDERGPWSNTQPARLPRPQFVECDPDDVAAPELAPPLAESGGWTGRRWVLSWPPVPGAVYTVEESEDPDFIPARVIYGGTDAFTATVRAGARTAYYRVRAAVDGRLSPWSNTAVLPGDPPTGVRTVAVDERPDDPVAVAARESLLAVHTALLRLCLARADILAVLALPRQYREQEAVDYATALAACLGAGEERALSYAAMYHPWTWVTEPGGGSRLIAPDGAAAGRMAGRAIRRGAWVAPANEDLDGVVALAPAFTAAGWEFLYERQINAARREARGFLLMSADTLSADPSLRPISVRRLLILLRRLALREGAEMVFQQSDESFARRVQRRFEGLLAQMFARGAFAGATPSAGFQVVTDASVNTRASLDLGRFIVELRVAPSLPLVFLTVRLVQVQGSGPQVTEV